MRGAYDITGRPITLEEALPLWSDEDDVRRVGKALLDNGYIISTVHLVWNHSRDENNPIIFESMVTKTGSDFHEIHRYSTLDEARQGHSNLAAKYNQL